MEQHTKKIKQTTIMTMIIKYKTKSWPKLKHDHNNLHQTKFQIWKKVAIYESQIEMETTIEMIQKQIMKWLAYWYNNMEEASISEIKALNKGQQLPVCTSRLTNYTRLKSTQKQKCNSQEKNKHPRTWNSNGKHKQIYNRCYWMLEGSNA